jgi:hypothetical protein
MISGTFSFVFTSSHRCSIYLSISTAISVPNLRNGYGMRRQESSEKAREGKQGIMRGQKNRRRWIKHEIEKKESCSRNVSTMKPLVSLLRSCNNDCFKSETIV